MSEISSTEPTKEDVLRFLSEENLKYQKVELPYGLSTPGSDRQDILNIAFGQNIKGQTVLDIGSYLGAFCIHALRKGARRAVGLELNADRLRQAREIARLCSLQPEYLRKDVEDKDLGERFDIVLCLNVLHHLRDPVGALRYLAGITGDRLLLEVASMGKRDRKKHRLGRLASYFITKQPAAYIGPCNPAKLSQTFFFTPSGLRRLLADHIKVFREVRLHKSEFKDRFILDCEKLSIRRMLLVAGVTSSGKTTVCERILRNDFSRELQADDLSAATLAPLKTIWKRPLAHLFPENRPENVIMHYDISQVERRKLHSYFRDPATDLLDCSGTIEPILVLPRAETIKRQLFESEIANRPSPDSFHIEQLERFEKPSYIRDVYLDWISFLKAKIAAPGRIFVYIETDGKDTRELRQLSSLEEAENLVHQIYG